MQIGLVGCVKSKRSAPSPARDLYTSALFRGARCFVERDCDQWFILSAQHQLVRPEQVLAPYERTLNSVGIAERRQWAEGVLGQLDEELGTDLSPHTFQIHAGSAYVDHGLAEGIEQRGGQVERPLGRLPMGSRLSFYKEHGCL